MNQKSMFVEMQVESQQRVSKLMESQGRARLLARNESDCVVRGRGKNAGTKLKRRVGPRTRTGVLRKRSRFLLRSRSDSRSRYDYVGLFVARA